MRIHRRIKKEDLQDPDNDNGVITQVALYILECGDKLVGFKMHHYEQS